MRHTECDFAHAQVATALDDLLERRDHQFGAFEAKTLGTGIFQIAEFLERLSFNEFSQDRFAPFRREADVFLRAFDPLLNPALLRRIGDVHELHADLTAIGASQNRENLTHRRRAEAHDAIDEDRPIKVGFGKTVGFRQQLAMHAPIGEAERVEVGGEMADDAIGADQHQRADQILRCAQRRGGRHFETGDMRTPFDLVADRALGLGVVACQCGDEIAVGAVVVEERRERRRPGGAAGERRPKRQGL